ncbi:MAG: hypothetical protein EOP84_27930 [Verrucomicrobiaceae bacterium]|nr:MAG: hypothetical protein EOP84_27930 [Verrucomicrobiaceae bacterium]
MIKTRGYTVQPGAVETAIVKHLAVHDCAVTAFGDGLERQLVAYVVRDKEDSRDREELDIDESGYSPAARRALFQSSLSVPGQKIQYEVTLKGIKQKALPELNDAFADSVVKGKTLEELRTMAREELSRQKVSGVETEKRNQIMRQLLSQVECELPQGLVRQETQRLLSDIVRENQARGVTEDVLKENEKELVGAAAQNARERLKGSFVLMQIAEAENIRVTREELFGRVAMLAQRYEMSFEKMLKELESRNALDQINEEILTAKALDFLVSTASVTNEPAAAPAVS